MAGEYEPLEGTLSQLKQILLLLLKFAERSFRVLMLFFEVAVVTMQGSEEMVLK